MGAGSDLWRNLRQGVSVLVEQVEAFIVGSASLSAVPITSGSSVPRQIGHLVLASAEPASGKYERPDPAYNRPEARQHQGAGNGHVSDPAAPHDATASVLASEDSVFPARNAVSPRASRDRRIRSGVRERGYVLVIRLIDIAVSSMLLTVTAPLLLAIAIVIRIDSPGPVIFGHRRVGENRRRRSEPTETDRRSTQSFGKPFTLYKFRTMHHDARERFPELYTYRFSESERSTLPIKILVGAQRGTSSAQGPEQLGANGSPDLRLTRVGRWLRRTSLDELPNLWNVLKGDLHLVGPRPDIEENARQYLLEHLEKFDVKPGITGLAQVGGRGHLSFQQINELDVEYVRTRSLALDMKILFKTLVVVLKGHGAY